jgi:predicted phosphoribosyltransferase
MRFQNRADAALLLVDELRRFKEHHPLVLGVPRGGVPGARTVSERLVCDFDVVLVRKLCTPEQPELAMGAVDAAGRVYHYGAKAAVCPDLYQEEVAAQIAEIERRRRLYAAARPPVSPTGHTAIIVDDGMATGATMVAAVRAVRAERPLRVVVAVPVASRGAVDLVHSYADDVICLYRPRMFYTVGEFYDDFATVADSDVVALLEAGTARRQ